MQHSQANIKIEEKSANSQLQQRSIQDEMDIINDNKIMIQQRLDEVVVKEECFNQFDAQHFDQEKQDLLSYKNFLLYKQKFFLDWENDIIKPEEICNQNSNQNLSLENIKERDSKKLTYKQQYYQDHKEDYQQYYQQYYQDHKEDYQQYYQDKKKDLQYRQANKKRTQAYNKTEKKHKGDVVYRDLNKVAYNICLDMKIINADEYFIKKEQNGDFLKKFGIELKTFRSECKKISKRTDGYLDLDSEEYQYIIKQLKKDLLEHDETTTNVTKKVKKQ